LRQALVALRPDDYAGADGAALAEQLAVTGNAALAAAARLAARAADRGAYRAKGFTDAAEWFARASGSSPSQAKVAIDTAWAVEECPSTKDAVMSGEVSLDQAAVITKTEFAVPGSEAELLDLAKTASMKSLKDRARDTRLGSIDVDELHRRQHKARQFRHWRNELGNICVRGELTPELGVPFVNALDAETDRVRKAARRAGGDESWDAYAADAFANLVAGAGPNKGVRADLVVVADINALRRGHPHEGEPCHIVGGGPIPVHVVRDLLRQPQTAVLAPPSRQNRTRPGRGAAQTEGVGRTGAAV